MLGWESARVVADQWLRNKALRPPVFAAHFPMWVVWVFFHPSKTTPQIKLSPLLKRSVDPIGVLNRWGAQTQAEVSKHRSDALSAK